MLCGAALSVNKTVSGWITPQHQVDYDLQLGETLELKTTTNEQGYQIIFHYSSPTYYDNGKYLAIGYYKWSTTWTYVIGKCIPDDWLDALTMNGVPSDETKVWQITRTSTNLVVVCNGVTVVNFNFATDYTSGLSGCYESWNRESTSISFSWSHGLYLPGHLFLRISDNCTSVLKKIK